MISIHIVKMVIFMHGDSGNKCDLKCLIQISFNDQKQFHKYPVF